MQIIPTRKALTQSWSAYSKLRQALAEDPLLGNDKAFMGAVERAHARWSEAFMNWDGK